MADIAVADLLWPAALSTASASASDGSLEGACAFVRLPAHAHTLTTRHRLVGFSTASSLPSSVTTTHTAESVENVENGTTGMWLRLEEVYVGLIHDFLRLRTPLPHACNGSSDTNNDNDVDDSQAADFRAKLLAAVARPPPPHSPLTTATAARLRVFRDLWERGFHVAFGSKFAAELLLYTAAPAHTHAVALVLVRDWDAPIAAVQLASHCRVATMVKKRLLLASWQPLQADDVVYVGVDHALLATRHEHDLHSTT